MRVFISYPSEHAPLARTVHEFIERLGIEAWLDQQRLVGGQHWRSEIEDALSAADLILILCSSELHSRRGVFQREIARAVDLSREMPRGHTLIVPLRVARIALTPELSELQRVDLFEDAWQSPLARALRLRLEQLQQASPAALSEFIVGQGQATGLRFLSANHSVRPNFSAHAEYLEYTRDEEYWRFVNATIASKVLGEFYEGIRLAPELIPDDRLGDWSLRVTEYFRSDDLVSLQFDAYSYFAAAHPTRGVYTMNFGGPDCGPFLLEDLFERRADVLEHLQLGCRSYFETGVPPENIDGTLWVNHDYARDPWPTFSQWNFDDNGIRIWLSMYAGALPFAAGVSDFLLPWRFFAGKVAPGFRNTAIGRFILARA